jgi:hypothetical protein
MFAPPPSPSLTCPNLEYPTDKISIKCSYHRLTWSTHKNQIVLYIMRILSDTLIRPTKVARSLRPSRAAVWRQKVKRYEGDHEIHPSGLRIVDRKRGRIYSRRDDFSGRFLDFEDD